MPTSTSPCPALYQVADLTFLLVSSYPVLYWMDPAALYAEMNKMDCADRQVIRPHSESVLRFIDDLYKYPSWGLDPQTGVRHLLAPMIDGLEFAHPTRERRINWSHGRHLTAAFATLGAPVVPLVCSLADAVILERIEADHAAGLLPATVQPYDKSLRAAKDRWDPFEVVVGVSSASVEQLSGEAARLDRPAREQRFKEELADNYPGARVRFKAEPDDAVHVHHIVNDSWLSRLLRVRNRRSTRLCSAAYQLSVELGL